MNYFIVLLSFGVTVIKGQSIPCLTPNGERATCVFLLSCPILVEAANRDAEGKKFVDASACPQGVLMVCCGKVGNFTQIVNKPLETAKPPNESNRDYVLRNKLLPSKIYCGMQHTDDYFYNETETSVDEFPWLVYISLQEDTSYYLRKQSNCVGVLISNRYVLTISEDCFPLTTGFLEFEPISVELVLGLHHIYKDVSCIPTRYDIDDCTKPILRTEAELWSRLGDDSDILILQLTKKIDYSDFVRPICLPLDDDDMPKPGATVFTSGWGEQLFVDGKSVKLKKRVKHTILNEDECENGNPVEHPICGILLENNTQYVCPGDNGGPLMYRHKNNWILAGIISKTATCDNVHPVVAERLTADTIDYLFEAIVELESD